jgi:hypothetical protein
MALCGSQAGQVNRVLPTNFLVKISGTSKFTRFLALCWLFEINRESVVFQHIRKPVSTGLSGKLDCVWNLCQQKDGGDRHLVQVGNHTQIVVFTH